MKRLALWLPVIVFAVLALVFARSIIPRTGAPAGSLFGAQDPMIGQSAPQLSLQIYRKGQAAHASPQPGPKTGSETRSVSEYGSGRARLVNFWATWCSPCIAEHPLLMQLALEGWEIDGVAYRDAPEKIDAVLAQRGNPFARVLLDPKGEAMMAYGTTGVPETFVINKNGVITLRIAGYISPEILETRLRPALLAASQD